MLREVTDFMDRSLTSGPFHSIRGRETGAWSPSIEVREKDKPDRFRGPPWHRSENVMVEVDNGVLVIRGERRREHTEQHEGFRRTERSYGSFYRAIPLPEGAWTDDARADFRNGVLEIKVPIEEAKSHRKPIPIQSGNWASGASGGSQR
jgi:HSP20 family protein